jgi:broad specificity phosphatase PhoE
VDRCCRTVVAGAALLRSKGRAIFVQCSDELRRTRLGAWEALSQVFEKQKKNFSP